MLGGFSQYFQHLLERNSTIGPNLACIGPNLAYIGPNLATLVQNENVKNFFPSRKEEFVEELKI